MTPEENRDKAIEETIDNMRKGLLLPFEAVECVREICEDYYARQVKEKSSNN